MIFNTTTNKVQEDDCIQTIFENDSLFEKITFEDLRWWTKWIILSLVQITLCIHLCMVNLDQTNGQMKFKVTPQEVEEYATIKSYRERLQFHRPVGNNIFTVGFPIITVLSNANKDEIKFYGLHGEAKYMGSYYRTKTNSKDGYSGQMTFLFHPDDPSSFWIRLKDRGQTDRGYRLVVNYKKFVELSKESKICATFQVGTMHAVYNIEMTNGCMFIKQLLHRWGSASRRFDFGLPENIPAEAKGAKDYVMIFHREQPCHFSMAYLKGRDIIHSIPLKKVYYESSHGRLTLEQFDGSLSKTKTIYSTLIQQSVQYYEENDKIYSLKTKIPKSESDDTGLAGDDMWLTGATLTYDVIKSDCYIVNGASTIFLTKDNLQFYVDGSGIMIVVKLENDTYVVLKNEKYGKLIENDFKKCGINSNNFRAL